MPLPHMALFRHARAVRRCPFIGADRKWLNHGRNDAIDPNRKSASPLPILEQSALDRRRRNRRLFASVAALSRLRNILAGYAFLTRDGWTRVGPFINISTLRSCFLGLPDYFNYERLGLSKRARFAFPGRVSRYGCRRRAVAGIRWPGAGGPGCLHAIRRRHNRDL
jgi:hypothetical protein